MSTKDTYSFWKYPWQNYALIIGAVLVVLLLIGEAKNFQFHSLVKDSVLPNWGEYQKKTIYRFVFYSVFLFNLIGQLFIGKVGKTEKQCYQLLFAILLISTVLLGIAGFMTIAHVPSRLLTTLHYLLLAGMALGTASAGKKAFSYKP